MYKSIIFDLGGVMVDFEPKAYLLDRLSKTTLDAPIYEQTIASTQ